MHNYFCHGRLSVVKKTVLFFVYGILMSVSMSAAAWTRGIKGMGIAHMTLPHRIEFTILGCAMSFGFALGLCLLTEKEVTMEKLKMYLTRFFGDVRKYYKYAVKSARADLHSEVANTWTGYGG